MKDLIVVGAGPAGSTAALFAARAGLDVTFLDKAKFPRYKSCGGALSYKVLDMLGSKAEKAINCIGRRLVVYSPSLRSCEYMSDHDLHFVIRKEWDHMMALDAADAGAEFREETMVTDVTPKDDHVIVDVRDGESLSAKYVVIADGTGLRSYKKKLGFTQPYDYMARTVCAETPMDDALIDELTGTVRGLHIFFGVVPRGYGWVFPKRNSINVGIGFSNKYKPDKNQFEIFADFVASLKGLKMLPEDYDPKQGIPAAIPFRQPFEPIGVGRVLLAGDAGGFVSPVTGEGISYGMRSAKIAVQTIIDEMEGTRDSDLVSAYKARWMDDFGRDMVGSGLPLADLVYKSIRRMELVVKMMIADEPTRDTVAKMILGDISYKEARKRTLRRGLIAGLKSLRV
ncbi:MAG: geranylgeranyl reductase family protein [Candidatus Thorarchaeota archaeon]